MVRVLMILFLFTSCGKYNCETKKVMKIGGCQKDGCGVVYDDGQVGIALFPVVGEFARTGECIWQWDWEKSE
jgi:hypothetical protein